VSTPATTLQFKLITETPFPLFGDVYEDITVKGATSLRMRWIGKAASETELTAHRFFTSRNAALGARTAWQAAKGREVFMVSELDDNFRIRVFVLDVSAPVPKPIVSSDSEYDWKLTGRFRVKGTA